MKDSKEYSPKVTKLFRSLKRKHGKAEAPSYDDPVQAVVDGLVIEAMSADQAAKAIKRMKSHFVDLNDVRVCRNEELLEVFRDDSPAAEKSAAAITATLNAIFDKYDKVTLDAMTHEGKRQAKKELEELTGITPFAISYCFMTALGGHAIPLNEKMLTYLRDNELVHPDADEHAIAGFLERQIAAADGFTFYTVLKAEAEVAAKTVTKKKTTAKKKTATKKATATKKKVVKKKTTAKKKTATKKKAVKKKTTKKK
ncbi:MAG: hypothetical protein ACYSUT_06285 [Planctomycetota bacterium]|jgi:hypothetical protein